MAAGLESHLAGEARVQQQVPVENGVEGNCDVPLAGGDGGEVHVHVEREDGDKGKDGGQVPMANA